MYYGKSFLLQVSFFSSFLQWWVGLSVWTLSPGAHVPTGTRASLQRLLLSAASVGWTRLVVEPFVSGRIDGRMAVSHPTGPTGPGRGGGKETA